MHPDFPISSARLSGLIFFMIASTSRAANFLATQSTSPTRGFTMTQFRISVTTAKKLPYDVRTYGMTERMMISL